MGENTRGQDLRRDQLSAGRVKAIQAAPRHPLEKKTKAYFDKYILPRMETAIKYAENDPGRFGMLTSNNPQEGLEESVENNLIRWIQAGKPGTYVDFMRDRYAPVGAENDPNNKNQYWNNNVRKKLLQQLGPEMYKIWERQNLARAGSMGRNV